MTTYECYLMDTETQRVTVAPQAYISLDEVSVFIRKHFGNVITKILILVIGQFTTARAEKFTYTQGNQTLVVKFHHI